MQKLLATFVPLWLRFARHARALAAFSPTTGDSKSYIESKTSRPVRSIRSDSRRQDNLGAQNNFLFQFGIAPRRILPIWNEENV
jgi:hypothetical protein